MKVMFACVADHAWVDPSGKLNVSGIFDRIASAGFPVQHPKMFLVFRLMMEYEDNDKPHKISFDLTDEDGQSMFNATAEVQAEQRVLPGEFATTNQIVELNNLVITHRGRYQFVFSSDGEEAFRVPFRVDKV